VQMPLLCNDIYWRGEQGASTTRRFRSALIGSLLFHCTLAGLAAAVVLQKPVVQEPVVIDLTTASLPEPQIQQQASKMVTRSRNNRAAPARSAPLSPPPPVAVPTLKSTAAVAQPVANLSAKTAAPLQQTQVGGEIGSASKAAGGGASTATGEGTGAKGSGQTAAETRETLQKRYLREHFAYIRDLIGKELRYPRQAIRMNWSGRVTVSFLVLVDGSVSDLRVSHSSGVSLLDRNALETVERAAPFPKPPVSARLVMPVDYVLE